MRWGTIVPGYRWDNWGQDTFHSLSKVKQDLSSFLSYFFISFSFPSVYSFNLLIHIHCLLCANTPMYLWPTLDCDVWERNKLLFLKPQRFGSGCFFYKSTLTSTKSIGQSLSLWLNTLKKIIYKTGFLLVWKTHLKWRDCGNGNVWQLIVGLSVLTHFLCCMLTYITGLAYLF